MGWMEWDGDPSRVPRWGCILGGGKITHYVERVCAACGHGTAQLGQTHSDDPETCAVCGWCCVYLREINRIMDRGLPLQALPPPVIEEPERDTCCQGISR